MITRIMPGAIRWRPYADETKAHTVVYALTGTAMCSLHPTDMARSAVGDAVCEIFADPRSHGAPIALEQWGSR